MKELFYKFYKKNKLSTGISVLICFISFSIAIIVFLISKTTIGYLLNNHLEKYMTYIHNEFNTCISDLSSQIHMHLLPLSLDSNLVITLCDNDKSLEQKRIEIEQTIVSNVLDESFIEKTAIILKSGEAFCFSQNGEIFDAVDHEFITGTNGYNIFLNDTLVTINGQNYVVFGKLLSNYYSGYNIGYIECFVNENTIYSMFNNSTLKNSETFLSCNGNIISHTDKKQLGKELYIPGFIFNDNSIISTLNSQKFISKYSTEIFADLNFDMISILDSYDYYKTLKNFDIFIILIFVFNLLISFLVAHYLSKKLTVSISALTEKINMYPRKITINESENNELILLERKFLAFENQIDILMEKNDIEKKKQKIAELAALQAQINPHFVYNALDSMNWIAKINHQEQIENICSALASYFRLGLHNGDNMIMIKDEIQHVKSYLTVEQIRFPAAFDVFFDIEENIYNLMTLKIIIQPIVENCIKHAFNQISHKGIIKICGYSENEDIVFSISDNGIGMDFDPLTATTTTTDLNWQGGYGVKNVHRRLVLEYGKGYGLSYQSVPSEGTTVIVRIKKRL